MLFSSEIDAKMLIMTHCYNKPEFISWQARTFEKFLRDDYEFIVFNDTPNEELFNETEEICSSLNLQTVIVPQEIHLGRENPSEACADTIQYMMNTVGFDYPGIVMLIDSDMFLIRDLNVEELLNNHDIAALAQVKDGKNGPVTYMLPNLIIFNMLTCPDRQTLNFDLGFIDEVNTDTAGFTHYYLKDHPELKWLKTNIHYQLTDKDLKLNPELIDTYARFPILWDIMINKRFDYEFYIDCAFLHFRAGSNWNKMEEGKLSAKSQLLSNCIEELLSL